jgi:hypothetical protein
MPATGSPTAFNPEADMPRIVRNATLLVLLSLLLLPGCAAVNQLAALRLVTFEFAGVSDVRLVGIPIGPGADYSNLGMADAARLAAAMLSRQAPIELVAHVAATNPAENKVTARMAGMDWKLFVEDHEALAGRLADPLEFRPGRTTDVPLSVRFDLVQLGSGGASDLFNLAIAIAGQGTIRKDLRLELLPTIETSAGPIRYPAPIVVHRLGSTQ